MRPNRQVRIHECFGKDKSSNKNLVCPVHVDNQCSLANINGTYTDFPDCYSFNYCLRPDSLEILLQPIGIPANSGACQLHLHSIVLRLWRPSSADKAAMVHLDNL